MEDIEKAKALPERIRIVQPEVEVPGQGNIRETYALLRACRHTWRRKAMRGRRAVPAMGILSLAEGR